MQPQFRIGTTSFIYHDEGMLPNVRRLAGHVQDVELVLYDREDYGSNVPSPQDVGELNRIARDHDLTYTVHLPVDLQLSTACVIVKALDATRALDPFGYVLHLQGRRLQEHPDGGVIRQWQGEMGEAMDLVLEHVDPRRLCVENLETWSPAYFAELVVARNLARCVDVGHFWKRGQDPVPHLTENLERTRIIHLHGVDGQDHTSLGRQARSDVETVLQLIRVCFAGVLTLEVYSEQDLAFSRQVLDEVLGQWAND